MRAKWWVGLMTIAVVAPFGAQADIHATNVYDLWDSGRLQPLPDLGRQLGPMKLQSDSLAAAVLGEPTTSSASMYRGFQTSTAQSSTAVGSGGSVAATPRVAAAAAAPAGVPEMNSGFAVTGLTFLFGSVAILRGRKPLPNSF